ncbi:MAG: flagellar biosynthetic protein FliO [Phycisphaerae bacterium]
MVLAVIAGAGILARRFLTRSQAGGADLVRVLSRTYLSPKQSVALVQLGGRFAFLGVTPDRISTLRIVEDAEEAGALRSELRVRRLNADRAGFDELLTAEAHGFKSAGRVDEHLEPALQTGPGRSAQMSKTRDELKGLLDKLRTRNPGGTLQRGDRSKPVRTT